jgi:glycosyltransferase involved in cell wall biosynthesis
MPELLDFSVVIPTYNRCAYVLQSLEAIRAQTLKPREIIVIDDGSTDGTPLLFLGANVDVQYIRIDNAGPGHARYHGLCAATSSWIAFCDSDDLWQPEHLAVLAGVVDAFPEARFVFSNVCNFRDEKPDELFFDHFKEAPADWWRAQTAAIRGDTRLMIDPAFPGFLQYLPAWPTASAVHRSVASQAGATQMAVSRLPSEDCELTGRFVILGRVACSMRTTVRLRKHTSNYSADHVANLIGRANVLMLGLLGHPEIYSRFVDAILNEARQDVLRAFQRALWHRRLLEAGRLFDLLEPFGLRAPKLKQRLMGQALSLCCRLQLIPVSPKLESLIALALRNLEQMPRA